MNTISVSLGFWIVNNLFINNREVWRVISWCNKG